MTPQPSDPDEPRLTSAPTTASATGPDTSSGFGPFRFLQRLGEGGMGEVWLAEQLRPVRRQVAIKVVKAGMDTALVVARFEAERQALAVMDHPAIAKIFDGGTTPEGRPYFAMEYVKGEAITGYCDRERLPIQERLQLFIQLCDGVQHAHQKGIIHRDLKPSNVLVSVAGDHPVPRIIDFGIAKAIAQPLTARPLFTELGGFLGTPEYMSPEQAELTPVDVDTRSDVYSLGVMLYEILVGTLPFDSVGLRQAGLDEIRRTIREKIPLRPSTRITRSAPASRPAAEHRRTQPERLAAVLRGDLDWIAMKALEKDRTRRYQTVNALALDVRRHLNDEPVSAGPPSTAYRTRKFVRRHRVGVAAAIFLVALLAAFAGIMTVQAGRIARERDRANVEAEASKQISEFMLSLFEVSDPGEARGNSITAREILDAGSAKIARGLKGQPLTQARLMDTIGSVYRSLGLYLPAASMLRQAVGLKEGALGPEHPDVARSLNALGWTYTWQGEYASAQLLHERALNTFERAFGPDHTDVGWSCYYLGAAAGYQGDIQRAKPLLERASRIFETTLGADHVAVSWCVNDLAVAHQSVGDLASAKELYERALRIKLKNLGPEHPDVARGLNNLGFVLTRLGSYAEAKPLLERALAINEKTLGPDNPALATSMHSLAELLRRMGQHAESRRLLERALPILEKSVGPDHVKLAEVMNSLADVHQDMSRYDLAEPLYRRALAIREKGLAPDHTDIAATLEAYAILLRETDRAGQAEKLVERARAIRAKQIGDVQKRWP